MRIRFARSWIFVFTFLVSELLASKAGAVAPPPPEVDIAAEMVQRAIKQNGLEVEPNPTGKKIEAMVIVPFPIFNPEDKVIAWANKLHSTTTQTAIQKEMLLKEGDEWNDALALESGRNLRKNLLVLVAQVVACKGTQPDSVKLMVVTRDFWSIRFSFEWTIVNSRIEKFYTGLFEKNFRGVGEWFVPFIFDYDLATIRFGQLFWNPRVRWSRIEFKEEGGPIFNHQTGKIEGGYASVLLGQPLYSLATKWGWGMHLDLQRAVARTFSQGLIARRTITETGESLPFQYVNNFIKGDLYGIRSWGKKYKHNLTWTWKFQLPYHEFIPESGTSYLDRSVQLMTSDIMPFPDRFQRFEAEYDFFEARYAKLQYMDTFGVIEDFRLGPYLSPVMAFAIPVGPFEGFHYTPTMTAGFQEVWGRDALASIESSVSVRRQWAPVVTQGEWVNQVWSLKARQAFPSFIAGRFLIGARFAWRKNDLSRTIESLGSQTALRGYPSGYYQGNSMWGANFEFRSRSFSLFKVILLGFTAFFDAGNAWDENGSPIPHASTGVGIRGLIPQISPHILGMDVGFPLTDRVSPSFVLRFGQAF